MKIIKASAEIIAFTPMLEQIIELGGRACYKSEDKITEDSASAFIDKIKNFKHESVLEHGSITVRFIVDRGVSHELVRHRLASFSQESTRYCNYSKNKFGSEITVIDPRPHIGDSEFEIWKAACENAQDYYFTLLKGYGTTPQMARSVLPNSLKTEVVMTANPREYRHIMQVRTHRDAHPQMREVMVPLALEFASRWPALFGEFKDVKFLE
jgi:thymidylate synthase (FAD)